MRNCTQYYKVIWCCHRVQLDQLAHQDPLVLKDHRENEAEMVLLAQMVRKEREVHKVNPVYRATLDNL